MNKLTSLIVACMAALAAACSPPPPPNDGGPDQDAPVGDHYVPTDDATDGGTVDVTPGSCVSHDTPGGTCNQNSDCCSALCDVNHRCMQNTNLLTPCSNNSDCPGGNSADLGLCVSGPLPDGGTGYRCDLLHVGDPCDLATSACPGSCSATTMTCTGSTEGLPCLNSRGDADCRPPLHCAPSPTGAGSCRP